MDVTVRAEPEPITLDTTRTALVVVDVQNSFARKGGMMDYWGKLDEALTAGGIKYLVFVRFFTNVCVESTLRDAFFRDYFPVLVEDACGNIGPDFTQAATVYNVKSVFGWVTTSADLLKALN